MYKPLSRQEIISVIEGEGAASRIPMIFHYLVDPGDFAENENTVRQIMSTYPQDVQIITITMPDACEAPTDCSDYRWVKAEKNTKQNNVALDASCVITDWSCLDEIISHFPSPYYRGMFQEHIPEDGRYRLGYWWHFLFERHWQLRGMENALMDYYKNAAEVHSLFRAVTDFYIAAIKRGKKEHALDGILVTDDLGMQTGSFFSNEIFIEFFQPYYKEIIDTLHDLDMHFWLHSCGCVRSLLPLFIDVGVDVIHPIQKYTMLEAEIAREFGHGICIWAGFDVQRIIPWGTPQEVRDEVRFMINTYYRPEGRFMLSLSNAIKNDCPIESLKAMCDEMYGYGKAYQLSTLTGGNPSEKA